MYMVPIGNIRLDPEVISKEKIIIPLFMSHGKMQQLMQNGRVKDCPPRPNGNLPQEVDGRGICTRGAMNSNRLGNGWPMFTRARFLKIIMVLMDLQVSPLLDNFRPMPMDCMIWPETYGNGVTTGTRWIIIKPCLLAE